MKRKEKGKSLQNSYNKMNLETSKRDEGGREGRQE